MVSTGCVYMLGTGPGDPELLTLRAAAVLAAADVVYHDQLVSAEVLQKARSGSGGEEVEALLQEGIPFEVVPGVSSAAAAAAGLGPPSILVVGDVVALGAPSRDGLADAAEVAAGVAE